MRRGRRIVRRFDEEPAFDVSELDLVASPQHGGTRNQAAHYRRAVLALLVFERRLIVFDSDAGVPPRHARVVDADRAVRLPSDRIDAGAEDETTMADAQGADHYFRRSNFLTIWPPGRPVRVVPAIVSPT